MCEYFILTKTSGENLIDDTKNQIVCLYGDIHILPKNNLTHYSTSGLFEKSLIEWCKQFGRKDKIFLDIGAHTGTYAISLSDLYRKVYAFEPQRMTYYSLCGSVALSNKQNVMCIQCGLGSEEQVGTRVLNIVSADGGGSTLHKENHMSILNTEEVEIKTLDSFGLTDIGFIKIDAENNELQILLSAVDTLCNSHYPPILFEMNTQNPELLFFLQNMNYNIIPIQNCTNMFLAVINQ